MSERRAIIVGWPGQDGSLLAELLSGHGYNLLCIGRDVTHAVGLACGRRSLDLTERSQVGAVVADVQPDEVYYLAAHHRSSEAQLPEGGLRRDLLQSINVHCVGLVNFLDALSQHAASTRLFYAASSLVFADAGPDARQTELTPLCPRGTYAMTKAMGVQVCRDYRRLGVFCSVGFLYNHESARRGPDFVTQRIVRSALRIRDGSGEKLALRDLDAVVDWGHAADYVDAFRRILALDAPDDFVIATGEGHTVREFAEVAFAHVGLDWRQHVIVGGAALARQRSGRVGDADKLRRLTGWAPAMSFRAMVQRIVDETDAIVPTTREAT